MILRIECQRDDGTTCGGSIPDIHDRPSFKAAVAQLAATVEEVVYGKSIYDR